MTFLDNLREFFFRDEPSSLPPNTCRTESGGLHPTPGFGWCTDAPGDFRVEWQPGKVWPERRLLAGPREGKWTPAPGYGWVRPRDPECLDVEWRPGYEDRERHLVARDREGAWRPEVGYQWVAPHDLKSLGVCWEAGQPHPRHPNVVTASVEGVWAAADGYRWVNGADSDDPRVERIPAQERRREPAAACDDIRDLAMLGLGLGASLAEVESSFRRLALLHHPDRFLAQGVVAVEAATRTFRMLREAYDRVTRRMGGGR